MKTLKIGIADYDRMKARTLAIARGEHKPARGEPAVWFTSIESFAKVLSGRDRELLETIARERPGLLTELAELAGRRAIVKSCVWADHAAARSWRSPSTNLTPRMISARWFDPSSFLHFL